MRVNDLTLGVQEKTECIMSKYGFAQQVLISFSEKIKEDAGGQIGEFFGVTVRFPAQPSQVTADTVVVALDREGVGFPLKVMESLENSGVRAPEIRAELYVGGVRKLRVQASGRAGVTTAQRPSADFLGSSINSPPQPARLFFLPIYVHSSSASTHSTSSGETDARTWPSTASRTQFITELWLTPTSRSVARSPTPSRTCASADSLSSGATRRWSRSPCVRRHPLHSHR